MGDKSLANESVLYGTRTTCLQAPTPIVGKTAAGTNVVAAMTAGGALTTKSAANSDFQIPDFDYQAFTYYGSTNNVHTRVFKTGGSGGATVATLTYTYVASGAVDDDDISTITQT